MDPASMMAIGKFAATAAPAVMDFGKQVFAGKQAENLAGKNEADAVKSRLLSKFANEDPNQQEGRQAASTNASASAQQGRNRADQIFTNQLKQGNNRADMQNTMAINDQEMAYRRGNQLADNYVTAAANQAQASNNTLNAIMNAPTAQYGSGFGR